MRIKRNPTFSHRGATTATKKTSDLGVTSGEKVEQVGGRMKATAAIPLRNTSISQLPIEIDIDPLLKDIIFSEDLEQKKLVMRIYKDIYYNDPIGGSSVDLYSTLPFSDINLGGVSDRRASRVFEEAMERLNIVTLMSELSVDLMVTGAFVGSLLPNASKNILADLIPYQYENCKIDPLPFYSQDPLITVAMPESYKNVLQADSPRIAKLRNYLGAEVTSQLTSDALELDPMTTLYIPRKSFTNSTGVSFFRRILPIWLMEKNLFRGTLVETARRQRGILHLMLGDGDQWMPTMADMQMAMELFQNADADPLGAVIATRMGIETNEIRCLSGNTLVHDRRGAHKLSSFVDHDINGKPFTQKVSFQVKGPCGDLVAIDEWHYHGIQQTYRVTSESGHYIIGTINHKNLVRKNSSGGVYKEALLATIGETAVGDMLYVDENVFDIQDKPSTVSRLRYSRIVSIVEESVEPVYDLSVKGNESGKAPLFIANGVVTSNSGGDFWKVTDMWDSTMAMKLRALGISESFLSGEANYSNADTSLTVFMESLRSYRDKVTTRLFYNKLFPLISAMNGYTVNSRGKFIQRDSLLDQVSQLHNHSVLDDGSRLLIPSVHWTKQLKPEGDQAYLDMLQHLTEKGVPVPLRAIAAAGGFNLNSLLADQDDDFELIKRIGEYQSKVTDLRKKYMPKSAEDDDDMGAFASAQAEMELRNRARGVRSSVLSQGVTGKMTALAQRNFGEAMEVAGETHDGKKRYLYNQKLANERVNRRIARSLSELSQRKGTPLTSTTKARYVE